MARMPDLQPSTQFMAAWSAPSEIAFWFRDLAENTNAPPAAKADDQHFSKSQVNAEVLMSGLNAEGTLDARHSEQCRS